MKTRHLLPLALTPLLATNVLAAQHAGTQTVIYSEVVTDPSSIVAGIPGIPIDLIDRPYFSPDGIHWALTVNINTGASTDDEVLIIDGVPLAREGTMPAWAPAGRTLGFMDQKLGILNSGAFVFGGDLDGALTDDDYIAKGDALGNIGFVVREGSQIPGAPAAWLAGFLDTGLITNLGEGYATDSVDGAPPPACMI